jgi:hypothetical protein
VRKIWIRIIALLFAQDNFIFKKSGALYTLA